MPIIIPPVAEKIIAVKQKPAPRYPKWRGNNGLAAQIILSQPWKFGGAGSAMVEWAERFMVRVEKQRRERKTSRAKLADEGGDDEC